MVLLYQPVVKVMTIVIIFVGKPKALEENLPLMAILNKGTRPLFPDLNLY
jgi:hypothetical protein